MTEETESELKAMAQISEAIRVNAADLSRPGWTWVEDFFRSTREKALKARDARGRTAIIMDPRMPSEILK